eukprot:TRINITY_DN13055_c0_g1_i1.p1 TRINITY_DN13055_c0_g1~~TRINITY_DN13055_c0_g1_i1.p1  ORF type:complete len:813 (+),score=149.26 TRINITY_DN13055_c0_g1_i1:87-2525(+)
MPGRTKPSTVVKKTAPSRPAKPPPPHGNVKLKSSPVSGPGTPASIPKTVASIPKTTTALRSQRSNVNAGVSIKPPGSPGASLPGSPIMKSPINPPTYRKSMSPPPQLPLQDLVLEDTTPGLIVVSNIDGIQLTAHQLQRMVQAVKQDLSVGFGIPTAAINIDTIKGHPLSISISLAGKDSRNSALAYFKEQHMQLPITCKLYSETTGHYTSRADIDYESSWLVSSDYRSTAPEIGVGMRVVRNNTYWMWGDQDGGGAGTVIDANAAQGWVVVRWDYNGTANKYRWGELSGGYDVKILPQEHPLPKALVPIHPPAPPISLGARVKRNPISWKQEYGFPDGGEGGMGTVSKVQGDPKHLGQWVEVTWDYVSPNPLRNQAYRWGVNGISDLIIVENEHRGMEEQAPHEAVRCIQVTALSSRGTDPDTVTRVQVSFDGGPPEYTSVWTGETPAWGETMALDIAPGIATSLHGRMLRVVLLGKANGTDAMTPLGGCELEMGHLVGPESQTLWLAMDTSMTSKLKASPHDPSKSLQTASSATAWLRLSIGFVFVQLQRRPDSPLVTHHTGTKQLAHGHQTVEDSRTLYKVRELHAPVKIPSLAPAPAPMARSHLVTKMGYEGHGHIEPINHESRVSTAPSSVAADSSINVNMGGNVFSSDGVGGKFVKARTIRTPVRDLSNDTSFLAEGTMLGQLPLQGAQPMRISPRRSAPPSQVLAPAPVTVQVVSSAPVPVPVPVPMPVPVAPQVPPADGDSTTVVEYLVQLAFDPVTVLEVAKLLKSERVEDISTLRLLSEQDLKSIGIPLGCRRKIAAHLHLK